MSKINSQLKYEQLKKQTIYDEQVHCTMILEIMADENYGTVAAFCVRAGIGDTAFYSWLKVHPVFEACYSYGKMLARYNWEQEAKELDNLESKEVGCKYEIWRLKGWSQFGIGKNSRIRVDLTKDGTPAQHYHDILKNAAKGDYTAGEIKQLMEAVNVGLNAHQQFELQTQIDNLKRDLEKVESRSNG